MEFNPSLFSDNYKMAFIDPNKLGSSNVSILNQTVNRASHETPGVPESVSFRSEQDTLPQDFSETLRVPHETGDMYSGRSITERTYKGSDSLLEGFLPFSMPETPMQGVAYILIIISLLIMAYCYINRDIVR